MSESNLVAQGAPTLAGLKTGNLFPCSYESPEELTDEIRRLNRILVEKGLRLIPMRRTADRVLLYLYRPAQLEEDLSTGEARDLLLQAGYANTRGDSCVVELKRRLSDCGTFPHEIGLFLSYPPADVRGFIEHRGRNSKLDGCWKVYSDVERAKSLFTAYKHCTDSYKKRYAMGASIAQLAVVV